MSDRDAVQAGNRRRIQTRAPRKDGFGDDKRQLFLDHLAGCSNITRAATAAGVSTATVNYHRRRDAAFAAQCAEALEVGYDCLEAALVERAAGAHYTPGPDAAAAPGPESVDTALALHLLSLRKAQGSRRTGRAGRPERRATDTELNAAILAKLEVLNRRMTAGRAQSAKPRKGKSA